LELSALFCSCFDDLRLDKVFLNEVCCRLDSELCVVPIIGLEISVGPFLYLLCVLLWLLGRFKVVCLLAIDRLIYLLWREHFLLEILGKRGQVHRLRHLEFYLADHAVYQCKDNVVESQHQLPTDQLVEGVQAGDIVWEALEDSVLQRVRGVSCSKELRASQETYGKHREHSGRADCLFKAVKHDPSIDRAEDAAYDDEEFAILQNATLDNRDKKNGHFYAYKEEIDDVAEWLRAL
jgi:hypothetical protein